jgi:pimeloyl-ACP methyl ester carboxylesterase
MILLAVALVLAGLAAVTVIGAAAIERADQPAGRFIEVERGRLHIVELRSADAPPVVLLHGASGNLGNMQLALGERLAARYRVILIDRPGHGWSDRPAGRDDASPAREAALIHQALARIGVMRPVLLGHSWAGAVATAYALDFPGEVAGLVLLAPVTHPWPGGVSWINNLAATPRIGPLVARTLMLPVGYFLVASGVKSVFAPQSPPPGYAAATGVQMILRPSEFIANAQDLAGLKAFVTAPAPRYGEIAAPVIIISGDSQDKVVSTNIHSRAIARQLPHARLIVLPGVGHMVQYAAPERVVQAIDELMASRR